MKPDYEMRTFEDSKQWRQWLLKNHETVDGLWMRMYKKASKLKSIDYAGALDQALCFGWIDGQRKSYDEVSYIQKFTPRRQRSLWSKRNIEYVARLEAAGLMQRAGRVQVESAKADGRWQAAYDKPSDMVVPEYFHKALRQHPKAEAQFGTLNKTKLYSIAWNLQTAKTEETRNRRQAKIISELEADSIANA